MVKNPVGFNDATTISVDVATVLTQWHATYTDLGYADACDYLEQMANTSDTFRRALVATIVAEVTSHADDAQYRDLLAACFISELAPDFAGRLSTMWCATNLYSHLSLAAATAAQARDLDLSETLYFARDRGHWRTSEMDHITWLLDGFGYGTLAPGDLGQLAELMRIDSRLRENVLEADRLGAYSHEIFVEWLELCIPHGMSQEYWRVTYAKELATHLGIGDDERRTLALALVPTWAGTYDELVDALDGLLESPPR
jgi:hypothetical protein